MFKRILFFLSPLLLFSVEGKSMEPTYLSQQKILVLKKWVYCFFKKGNVVVLKDPRTKRLIIKRIKDIQICHSREGGNLFEKILDQIENDTVFYVIGDNKEESTDSRDFGWVTRKSIIGKVIYP